MTIIPRRVDLFDVMIYCLMFQARFDGRLRFTWQWLMTVLDSTEAQLRYGCALAASSDPSHPTHPQNPAPAPASTTTGSSRMQRVQARSGKCNLYLELASNTAYNYVAR